MKVKRGDIYWITSNPYRGTTGHVQKPGRPGIIVSNDANNACAFTYEIVYLTSQPKKDLPTHCAINSVPKPGLALCEQITTVSDEQVREYIGHCTDEEMEQVDRCIAISLGLAEPTEADCEAAPDPEVEQATEDPDTMKKIHDMELDLAAANARVHMLTQLYNDLLGRAIG